MVKVWLKYGQNYASNMAKIWLKYGQSYGTNMVKITAQMRPKIWLLPQCLATTLLTLQPPVLHYEREAGKWPPW